MKLQSKHWWQHQGQKGKLCDQNQIQAEYLPGGVKCLRCPEYSMERGPSIFCRDVGSRYFVAVSADLSICKYLPTILKGTGT